MPHTSGLDQWSHLWWTPANLTQAPCNIMHKTWTSEFKCKIFEASYSWKFWQEIKSGSLVVCLYNSLAINISYILAYMRIAIPYWTNKFRYTIKQHWFWAQPPKSIFLAMRYWNGIHILPELQSFDLSSTTCGEMPSILMMVLSCSKSTSWSGMFTPATRATVGTSSLGGRRGPPSPPPGITKAP